MKIYKLITLLGFVLVISCKSEETSDNILTKEEIEEGWQPLFDGKTLTGWHLYNMDSVPLDSSAWEVTDGVIAYNYHSDDQIHEDLVTDKEYKDFDFTFEWKITPEGNSGVFINVKEHPDIPTAWASGPEYQLLDSLHIDYQFSPKKRPGVLFNLTEQITSVPAKPAGEWNTGRIKQENGVVEFYLNGILTTQMDFNSTEWENLVTNSGFTNFPDFGKATQGKIGLQRWQNNVGFRNLKIKEL